MVTSEYLSDWMVDGAQIMSHYEARIARHGLGSKALDWRTDDEESFFYSHGLMRVDVPVLTSVLDVGCGRADLLGYLKRHGADVREYVGVDVVPAFVEQAKTHYPDGTFSSVNFVSSAFAPVTTYDLVANFGGLNSRTRHYDDYVAFVVEKMISLSGRYVIFNIIVGVEPDFWPKHNQNTVGHITAFDFDRLRTLLKELSDKYVFRHEIRLKSIFPKSTDAFVCLEKF